MSGGPSLLAQQDRITVPELPLRLGSSANALPSPVVEPPQAKSGNSACAHDIAQDLFRDLDGRVHGGLSRQADRRLPNTSRTRNAAPAA
jgi:hypothetical protein